MLQTGTVGMVECTATRRRPQPAETDPLAAVRDALAAWSDRIGVSVSADCICAPTQAAGLQLLLRAVQAGEVPARRLELMLPSGFPDRAGPDCLLALAALRDSGVALVLDTTQSALPGPEVLDLLSLTGLLIDARLLSARRPDRARLLRLRALLHACGELGVTLMASGIETEVQRAILCGLGCVQGSGDLFGLTLTGKDRHAVLVH